MLQILLNDYSNNKTQVYSIDNAEELKTGDKIQIIVIKIGIPIKELFFIVGIIKFIPTLFLFLENSIDKFSYFLYNSICETNFVEIWKIVVF